MKIKKQTQSKNAEQLLEKMRDALKELESTVTATLAHQPEDDEKCSQFLYDALVKVYNIADLACHEARDKCAAPAVNGAKLREALKKCLLYIACAESVGIGTITLNDKVKLDPKKIIKSAKEALAAPPRNCDLLSAEECKRIFAAEMDVYLPPEATDNDRTIATIVANSVIDTLFAPATEKEGSAK